MSTKFLTSRDFSNLEMLNARLQNLPTTSLPTPTAGLKGSIMYDSTLNLLAYCNGTVWTYPSAVADATTGSKGIIQLAGDLAGTAASPQIAAGAIVDADVNASAGIALSKLATNPLARANHTGTQTASTISDFDTQVRTSRLDQMAAPTAAVPLNAQKITGLADPTSAQDASTKAYTDALFQGQRKTSVRIATTANVGLSGLSAIDGATPVAGDRILVKNQTTTGQNGIYTAAAGAWTRSVDMDTAAEVDGFYVIVEDGAQAGGSWYTVSEVTTLGTDPIVWTKMENAGDIVAGAGLSKTGLTLSIPTDGVTSGMILDGTIVNADINASAGIALSKLATDPLARANHTGTQLASTISDFDNQVSATSRFHPVRLATTANISISSAPATIGGFTMVAGDRVGLTAQTTGTENGVWVWNSTGAAMTRAVDWATGSTRLVGETLGLGSTNVFMVLNNTHVVNTGTAAFTIATSAPSGAAGGDLTGSYPNPTIAAGAVDSSKILDGSIATIDIANLAVTGPKLGTGAVDLTSNKVTGALPIANGGTGATSVASIRVALRAPVGVDFVSTSGTTTTINTAALNSWGINFRVYSVTVVETATSQVVEADVFIQSSPLQVDVTFGSAVGAGAYTILVVGY